MVYAGSLIDASQLKGFLDKAGIKSFLNDEIVGVSLPWSVAAGGVKVVVAKSDLEAAKAVVEDFLKTNQ